MACSAADPTADLATLGWLRERSELFCLRPRPQLRLTSTIAPDRCENTAGVGMATERHCRPWLGCFMAIIRDLSPRRSLTEFGNIWTCWATGRTAGGPHAADDGGRFLLHVTRPRPVARVSLCDMLAWAAPAGCLICRLRWRQARLQMSRIYCDARVQCRAAARRGRGRRGRQRGGSDRRLSPGRR